MYSVLTEMQDSPAATMQVLLQTIHISPSHKLLLVKKTQSQSLLGGLPSFFCHFVVVEKARTAQPYSKEQHWQLLHTLALPYQ